MTDGEFLAWLKGWSATYLGCDFGTIVAYYSKPDGTIDREKTLAGFDKIPESCKKKLLEIENA